MSGVEEAHVLSGVYDLLVKISAASIEHLKDIIRLKLGNLPGIAKFSTIMIND